jgi:hypothetical protein
MKLHGSLTINGKAYAAGDEVPGAFVYPFFLLHMGMFGASGFFLAYGVDDVPMPFLFLHGGIAIVAYLVFYLAIFGKDEVRWMLTNAALGIFGISIEIGWLLGLFGKSPGDYPWYRHIVPFGYYVLYTFLLRHLLLDATGARDDPGRRRRIESAYVWGSALLYLVLWIGGRLQR